ncbi:glycosyl transferase, putative [Phytophthora infestans T30-4]|uniref:glucan endo-1,3-beta-D-glucosidase n=1 Tax=Phytophthora infestans (strain T30-4) TaxID=403677 RepID=D0N0L9_PHYIT|nr:glycosyl transferase, putative [Phytophthora infestans T30-4]EEY67182.1 glycosyl transferase, putative [Phytophthora infestans T30-4]|eukprot:XP_002905830.1 glycosyl transferase, putative [Phytophthora infestans T30-4]
MVCATYKTTFAMMAALAISSADATGTCYAPWHHLTVNKDVLKGDIQKIGQFFSSFRTFETRMSGLNVIDIAAEAGVKVSPGVQMNDLASVDAEIQAVCDGYKRNPSAVDTIWVGNECLQNGDFGTVSADQLVGYIQKVKECTGGGVPVGTVQRINEWNSAPGVDQVAGACDKQGANIYPFFTQGEQKPIEKLEAQWKQMTSKYDAGKIQLTETGWPTEGETWSGNTPSLVIMQEYLNDFVQWSAGKGESFWFMMFDTTTSYTGAEYEKHFGCFDKDGNPKVSIPGGFKDGSTTTTPTQGSQIQGSSTGSQTQQGTPVPTEQQYAVDVPEYRTEAPGTPPANDGGDQTQQGTPAPTEPQYAVDVPEYRTEAPGTPPANNGGDQTQQGTPAPTEPLYAVDVPEYRTEAPTNPTGEIPAQDTPAQETPVQGTPSVDVPTQDVPTPDTPSVTPAPVVQSGKDCAM